MIIKFSKIKYLKFLRKKLFFKNNNFMLFLLNFKKKKFKLSFINFFNLKFFSFSLGLFLKILMLKKNIKKNIKFIKFIVTFFLKKYYRFIYFLKIIGMKKKMKNFLFLKNFSFLKIFFNFFYYNYNQKKIRRIKKNLKKKLISFIMRTNFKKRYKNKIKKINFNDFSYKIILFKQYIFYYYYFFFLKKYLKLNFKLKYAKNFKIKLWVFFNANYAISKKSKNARMGKGKGNFLWYETKLKKNFILLRIFNLNLKRILKLTNFWKNKFFIKVFLLK